MNDTRSFANTTKIEHAPPEIIFNHTDTRIAYSLLGDTQHTSDNKNSCAMRKQNGMIPTMFLLEKTGLKRALEKNVYLIMFKNNNKY